MITTIGQIIYLLVWLAFAGLGAAMAAFTLFALGCWVWRNLDN